MLIAVWASLAVLFLLLELVTLKLYLLALGAGALVSALTAFFGVALSLQFTAFALVALAGSLLASRRNRAKERELQSGPVLAKVLSISRDGSLTVRFKGKDWPVKIKGQPDIQLGQHVTVLKIERGRMYCAA